jgi:hypothetical protein
MAARVSCVVVEAIKEYGSAPFVVVAESLARKSSLGSRLGSHLLPQPHPTISHDGCCQGGLWVACTNISTRRGWDLMISSAL